tara:strand:- start:6046 stop:6393 length:348 start_codon:yes stop_codon:yes gene_type:complete
MIATVAGTLGTAACAPATLFEWGNYESALYAYSQNPENRQLYQESLEVAIERGLERGALAPGLMAELGYLHLEAGNTAEALRYFQEERSRFPESAKLMDRMIDGLSGTGAARGTN